MGASTRTWLIVAASSLGLAILAFVAMTSPAPMGVPVPAEVLRDRATVVARDVQATVAVVQAARSVRPPVAVGNRPASAASPVARPAASPALVAVAPLSSVAGPSPTPSLTLAARTLLEEEFADNRAGWPDDPQSTAWLADGAYRLVARQPGQFVAIPAPVAEPLHNVSVTGTFRKVGGPPGGGYGVVIRARGAWSRPGSTQGVRFYVLEVGDRGEIGIWRRDEDRWEDLLPWTPSEAVRPGSAPNEVTALAVGSRLALEVNGTRVATVEEHALDVGAVGVFVGGDFNEVALERFAVQELR